MLNILNNLEGLDSERAALKLIGRIYGHLSDRRRRQLSMLAVLMVASSLLEALSIGSMLPFLGALTSPEKTREIFIVRQLTLFFEINTDVFIQFILTILFIILLILSALVRLIYFWCQTRLGISIGIDFSVKVYENTLHLPYVELISKNSSEILAGAQKAKDLVGIIIQPALTLISSTLMLAVVLVTLLAVEPKVAISGMVGFGLLYVIATTFSKRLLYKNSRTYAKELGLVNRIIQEGIGGIRDVIINRMQFAFTESYRNSLTKMQRAAASNLLLAQIPRFIIEMLGMTIMVVIAYVSAISDGGLLSVIPIIGVLALSTQRMLPVLQQAYVAYSSIRGGSDSVIDVLELLNQNVNILKRISIEKKYSFKNEISLRGISFKYPNTQKFVIKNLDLVIKKGSRIGIIGETGSGKSTLIDLIIGLLTPNEGAIYIDNKKLLESEVRLWQECISHVPQSIYLSDASIAENIAFGESLHQVDIFRVKDAAKIAQLSKTVEEFDEGFSTNVGERGVKLSGGQRQRICIARAIYKNSLLLIMDEGTSALDSKIESELLDAINSINSDITIIYIAHKLNTLRNCDEIFELQAGSIVWHGKYDELLACKQNLT